jgi:hypothetical protein
MHLVPSQCDALPMPYATTLLLLLLPIHALLLQYTCEGDSDSLRPCTVSASTRVSESSESIHIVTLTLTLTRTRD